MLPTILRCGLVGALACLCVAARPPKKGKIQTMGVVKRVETFKTIGDVKLKLHIYEKEDRDLTKPAPVAVFFFGGGWVG
ncbi:MAG: hypothetical protein HN849_34165, partial [Victivallales bacterium]|nr:hypothetical protein [Victivallales bacterium]